jgi:hypothetical protein
LQQTKAHTFFFILREEKRENKYKNKRMKTSAEERTKGAKLRKLTRKWALTIEE